MSLNVNNYSNIYIYINFLRLFCFRSVPGNTDPDAVCRLDINANKTCALFCGACLTFEWVGVYSYTSTIALET